MELALLGGRPVRPGPWPLWPPPFDSTAAVLADVVRSGRWSPTGVAGDGESYDRRFSRAFAAYLGTERCVTACNGTAALRLALEALEVGAGDEVVVPALTWIADVDAVLSVGAVPVLVDVDPSTLCIAPEAAARALGPRTRAVIAVHLGGAVADLGALVEVLEGTGVSLLEDAAQAHGATWRGTRAGSVGAAGAFSMHNSKLLTSGEGGAVATSSHEVADRLEELKANGRRPGAGTTPRGEMEYRHMARLTGTNGCLSEFQAAVLLDMLGRLDELNAGCEANARHLEAELSRLGFTAQATTPGTTRVYSSLTFAVPAEVRARVPLSLMAQALTAECRVAFKRLYEPLDRSPLFKPESRPAWRWFEPHRAESSRLGPPAAAWKAYETMLTIPHPYLRGTSAETAEIVAAVEKVLAGLSRLEALHRGAAPAEAA